MGVMQALTTMLQAVCGTPEVFPQMEPGLLPLIERCLRQDAQDHMEDVLEVLSYLTYYSPQVGCHALSRMEPRRHAPVSPAAIRAPHTSRPPHCRSHRCSGRSSRGSTRHFSSGRTSTSTTCSRHLTTTFRARLKPFSLAKSRASR